MRTIKELLGTEEKVWFYIDSEELWQDFLELAKDFCFGEMPREKWKFGYVIAVHSNREMGHVPVFIWCMSFGSTEGVPVKYDLRKIIDGEEDIICNVPHFKGKMIC
ncbi:hypothetical protein SAMN02910265_02353 [Ruminococcus flavefaciens]|uniref:Uncharacterized protein n=1 Tax=Ruminococcus flavefaciens TaxID=1265 RepID=A0A1H6KLG8_RUMFL|nr:hypothetical protein [Ruminococcus flavefaciens]SEH72675.1 hypothetical protein SAMN02910265_02353 [Ruminococcus flavefaciens]